ncbi:MAG: class I tRNA ligase family protein, partial [archaeon]|nr:class I tRNA ligase family protein [archaeon]
IKADDFEKVKGNLREIDKWILSRFAKVKKEATESLEEYEFSKALSAVRNFFWLEFADYYIEMVKHRVYDEEQETENGKAAKVVLVKIITELLKMLAPFVPHIAEEIFQENFKETAKKKSIHLEKWPLLDEKLINEKSEKAGEIAKEIIAGIRKYKSENNLSMNAELASVKVSFKEPELIEKVAEDIKATMKVKELKSEKTDSEELKIEAN